MTSKHTSLNSQGGGSLSIGDLVAARGGRCHVTPERASELVGYIPIPWQKHVEVPVATAGDPHAIHPDF